MDNLYKIIGRGNVVDQKVGLHNKTFLLLCFLFQHIPNWIWTPACPCWLESKQQTQASLLTKASNPFSVHLQPAEASVSHLRFSEAMFTSKNQKWIMEAPEGHSESCKGLQNHHKHHELPQRGLLGCKVWEPLLYSIPSQLYVLKYTLLNNTYFQNVLIFQYHLEAILEHSHPEKKNVKQENVARCCYLWQICKTKTNIKQFCHY